MTSTTSSDVQRYFEIDSYHDFISPRLAQSLIAVATPVDSTPSLLQVGSGGGLETSASLAFLVSLYQKIKPQLIAVLRQRQRDHTFIDERVKALAEYNRTYGIDFLDPDYKTVLGLEDASGRIVVGPKSNNYCRTGGKPVAPLPNFMQGPQVTLFGPPDSAKMAVNAMNAYHRKLKGEPTVVEELLQSESWSPTWGADDEDSKTPLRQDLIDAAVNLTSCFDGKLEFVDPVSKKSYALAADHLSQPMKRFPGLALPCTFLFLNRNPLPLHLYDFALHLFKNWHNPKALVFYVPKLENEEEAAYIHTMISTAEAMLKELHPEFILGSVRVMIVLENPRAILRTHEIIDALHPYFIGASLGWHDYLASTARLFKEDPNYRIPVKADPNIVIKYIKASHSLLADVVGSRGGIKVGGMYGLLPLDTDIKSQSFQITLKGFFKDIVTQLKRDLTGFWVAHPDFVRLGLAIVAAWKKYESGNESPLLRLINDIFIPGYAAEVEGFVRGSDISGLDRDHPNYVRSLLVADIKESDFIPNHHPDEIRYNIFQSLQYLTDWLSGNGCVALPTTVEGIPVRVMDDLATAERSRWEVWAELYHGRFKVEDFLRIAYEEYHFIRKDLSDDRKIVQVKWDERTSKWYPVALRLMLQLMTTKKPVEFATELLLPFTVESIRAASDPFAAALAVDSAKFVLEPYIERFTYYFERCGVQSFAEAMASQALFEIDRAQKLIEAFTLQEVIAAASFHGDIGAAAKTLDALAIGEQSGVHQSATSQQQALTQDAHKYLKKFGFKFLVSAQGKSATELHDILRTRLTHSAATELSLARQALWDITRKRMEREPLDCVLDEIGKLLADHGAAGVSLAVKAGSDSCVQSVALGYADIESKDPVTVKTQFEIASLSKTFAAAFAVDFLQARHIDIDSPVNQLLAKTQSAYRITSPNETWSAGVTVRHLLSHTALSMHYVNGFPATEIMPKTSELLNGHGYAPISVVSAPGAEFHYSGGGFLVLEHLIETLAGQGINEVMQPWLEALGLNNTTFDARLKPQENVAKGYHDKQRPVPNGRLQFPALAAGGLSTSSDVLSFLGKIEESFHHPNPISPLSHDAAVQMMHGVDRGCREFMSCDIGLGVFVGEAGDNRLAIHQGANDGFRALYVHTMAGPDRGKGFTVLCNGDNNAVPLIAGIARVLLKHLKITGVDQRILDENFRSSFNSANIKQEELVNRGYAELIFNAFEPCLPEQIIAKGPRSVFADLNLLGHAKITNVTNQKFARAENLLSQFEPVFDPELFGRQGKIMDSWETVRHNPLPTDYLDLEMQAASRVRYVWLSTKFHDGNQAPKVQLLGKLAPNDAWSEFLPAVDLIGHGELRVDLGTESPPFKFVRVVMIPDGGLSRLGLFLQLPSDLSATFRHSHEAKPTRYADIIPKTLKPLVIPFHAKNDQRTIAKTPKPIDYGSMVHGARVVHATNEHYGPAVQVISPFPPLHMFDGLESARSRKPGHFEEVIIELAQPICVGRVVVNFKYFVNNNPRELSIDFLVEGEWQTLAKMTPVKAFAGNLKTFVTDSQAKTQQLRIRTFPDGGINRIHVYERS